MLIVIKRDGREEQFNKNKILNAIKKAFIEVDKNFNDESKLIAKNISDEISNMENEKMSVEDIQDIVENKLMQSERKDVAKAYILYRNERTKIRERNSRLVKKVIDRINSNVNNHSNANVDEDSFSGREKEASADIHKMIALDYDVLSEDVANAHKEMLIYQHDLEKAPYGVHNCLNLNFQEIFTYGFRTRNGDVRPPTSFSTACQLVAVAFQCQSQVQFGGVGSIHLDYDLAPFVKKSFKKHYEDGKKYIEEPIVKGIEDIVIFETENWHIDNPVFQQYYPKAYKYAMDMLEKEGQQSTQALYHNLNTLESRQGSQVPFTSINLGRDTSIEGRLVTKWIMDASIDGIGKHHLTSIFPISIFQYKSGVNADKGNKNYDLKQIALESMSKRIYPNWCNCDWSQAHEDENNPDTFFSTINKTVA